MTPIATVPRKKTLHDIPAEELAGKRLVVRVDFNVPMNGAEITDDTRIRAALKTIQYLIKNHAKIILLSHLGRPKGTVQDALRLTPIARHLSTLLNQRVLKSDDCIGPEVEAAISHLQNGEIILLENTRFHAEETDNNPEFAKKLAQLGDLFVNDAFGVSHRADASISGITNYLPAVAGFLVEEELSILTKVLNTPERPLVSIIGGAKISSKFGVLQNILGRVDTLIIGGGMSFTLLKAQGYEIGKSLYEPDLLEAAKTFLENAKKSTTKLILPLDHIIVATFDNNAPQQTVDTENIPQDQMGVDVGPKTIAAIQAEIQTAKTIVWNGPLGVFEMDNFAHGTLEVAHMLAKSDAFTLIGGGDSAAAIAKANVTDQMSYISTGGGATLEFLEGKQLPGITSLQNCESPQ